VNIPAETLLTLSCEENLSGGKQICRFTTRLIASGEEAFLKNLAYGDAAPLLSDEPGLPSNNGSGCCSCQKRSSFSRLHDVFLLSLGSITLPCKVIRLTPAQ
jgi:hypothetical protein